MFDTHAHLEMLNDSVDTVLSRAGAAGVTQVLAVGSSSKANAFVKARKDPAVYKAIGFDRDEAVKGQTKTDIEAMISELRVNTSETGIHAIGETGLDFHYSLDTAEEQMELFNAQLDLARELELPIIVHSRDAEPDTLASLSRHTSAWQGAPNRIGVIHCFTGSMDFALKAIHLGFMISFSGILTFKNAADLRDVAAAVPEDMILVETDSPYLAPEPHRGRKNEPALLPHTISCLAKIRGTTEEDMMRITTTNACRLLGIEQPPGSAA